jgi:hypothetical protein
MGVRRSEGGRRGGDRAGSPVRRLTTSVEGLETCAVPPADLVSAGFVGMEAGDDVPAR